MCQRHVRSRPNRVSVRVQLVRIVRFHLSNPTSRPSNGSNTRVSLTNVRDWFRKLERRKKNCVRHRYIKDGKPCPCPLMKFWWSLLKLYSNIILNTLIHNFTYTNQQHNHIMEANEHHNHVENVEKMWKSSFLPIWVCKEEKGTIFDDISNLRKVDA